MRTAEFDIVGNVPSFFENYLFIINNTQRTIWDLQYLTDRTNLAHAQKQPGTGLVSAVTDWVLTVTSRHSTHHFRQTAESLIT